MGKCPFQERELGGVHLQTPTWPLGTKDFWMGVSGPSYICARVLNA